MRGFWPSFVFLIMLSTINELRTFKMNHGNRATRSKARERRNQSCRIGPLILIPPLGTCNCLIHPLRPSICKDPMQVTGFAVFRAEKPCNPSFPIIFKICFRQLPKTANSFPEPAIYHIYHITTCKGQLLVVTLQCPGSI
jgi:hypothetical protein